MTRPSNSMHAWSQYRISPCQFISTKALALINNFTWNVSSRAALQTLPWSDNWTSVTTGSEVLVVQLYTSTVLTQAETLRHSHSPIVCLIKRSHRWKIHNHQRHFERGVIDSCNITVERYLFVVYQVGLNSPLIDY